MSNFEYFEEMLTEAFIRASKNRNPCVLDVFYWRNSTFYTFFFFFSCACGIQKFPGQGLNPYHSNNPSLCSGNVRFLTAVPQENSGNKSYVGYILWIFSPNLELVFLISSIVYLKKLFLILMMSDINFFLLWHSKKKWEKK